MVARLQGFRDSWEFCGPKTAACRQVGSAFPPPVAAALGTAIATAFGQAPHCRPRTGQAITHFEHIEPWPAVGLGVRADPNLGYSLRR